MFFDNAYGLLRVLGAGVLTYIALLILLRISGKRTLAKLNAFDFVVTVALGSTVATILLSTEVALAEGVFALAVLISLQLIVAFLSVRAKWFQRLVKSEPTVLVTKGEINHRKLRTNRVAPEEIHQAVRASGTGSMALVDTVVLETDGSFSVITTQSRGDGGVIPDN